MSAATKRKHVEREAVEEDVLPEDSDFIAKVICGKGNNLHEVQDQHNNVFLVSMPTKFRKNIWIKRGDYVLCTPIDEGDKVKAEIIKILYKDNIKFIKKHHKWPGTFNDNEEEVSSNRNGPPTIEGSGIDNDMLPPTDSDSDSC